MRARSLVTLIALVACKRAPDREAVAPLPSSAVIAHDAVVHDPVAVSWYRATMRTPDGVAALFFLGVTPHEVIFKVGSREVSGAATFDHKTLAVRFPVYQTALDATVQRDGSLAGSFSSRSPAWGATTTPLVATPVAAPTLAALATVAGDGAPLDLGEPRTTWRLAMNESGVAKLVLRQVAPGELEGQLAFDSGALVYIGGTARGDAAVLTGFEGTRGSRLELAFDRDHRHARAKWFTGPRLEEREAASATRSADFTLALRLHATSDGGTIGLPDLPELAHLPPGPLLVELAASWCSTCRSAAPFLHELYRELQPRGLTMVTLLYELSDDDAVNARQAAQFKATYDVKWPVIAVPGTTDDLAKMMPTGLENLDPAGLPLLLFLGKDRQLLAFHTGFPAPDSETYADTTAEIRANVEKMLATK